MTVWHFCSVAVNFEFEQQTLARTQEMLVMQTLSFIVIYDFSKMLQVLNEHLYDHPVYQK